MSDGLIEDFVEEDDPKVPKLEVDNVQRPSEISTRVRLSLSWLVQLDPRSPVTEGVQATPKGFPKPINFARRSTIVPTNVSTLPLSSNSHLVCLTQLNEPLHYIY